jgi:hypothetical protein
MLMQAAQMSSITFSGINLICYAVVQPVFGIRHIKIAAAKPVVLSVITAGLTFLLLQPIDHCTLSSTVLKASVFLALFAGAAWFLLMTDEDREIISLLFAPTPRIEGNCE